MNSLEPPSSADVGFAPLDVGKNPELARQRRGDHPDDPGDVLPGPKAEVEEVAPGGIRQKGCAPESRTCPLQWPVPGTNRRGMRKKVGRVLRLRLFRRQ